MKIFDKFKLKVLVFFLNVKQIKIDKDNRKKFLEDIRKEIIDSSSKFNLYKMSMDRDFMKMSCFIIIPENYQLAGTEAMILSKLKEETRPINEYIGRDLAWGEYFIAPEFFYVEDTEDTENVSCTYIASWNYTPVLESTQGFWGQFAVFIGINILLLGGIIGGLILLF